MRLTASQLREIIADWVMFNHGKAVKRILWDVGNDSYPVFGGADIELVDLVEVKDGD